MYIIALFSHIDIRTFILVDSASNGKRGLYFGHMISCETGRSFLDYLDYGCFCGLGGGGTPVDDVDGYVHVLITFY